MISDATKKAPVRHTMSVEPATDVLLLRPADAARVCGVSTRTWRSWFAAGRIPAPVKVGSLALWRMKDLQHWCAAGTPARPEFERMQEAAERRKKKCPQAVQANAGTGVNR